MSERLLIDPSTKVPDVVWTIHRVNMDSRGSLTEAFRVSEARELKGFHIEQVNISVNDERVIRGMHVHEHQFDYWYIAQGFLQVAVSKNAQVETRILAPGHGVVIPPRTFHGFLSLTKAILIYGVSREFDEDNPDERGYEPTSGPVQWLLDPDAVTISDRDRTAPPFTTFM